MIEIASGFCFPEVPRWHADRLWFSDRDTSSVFSMTLTGAPTKLVETSAGAMGLGFVGDVVRVVSQSDRKILDVHSDGSIELFADLSELTPHWLNDMIVLEDGSGYVGSFGFDLMNRAPSRPARLIHFTPFGEARFTGPELEFPNGMALRSSHELVVAESFGSRISILTIGEGGELTERRTLSDLGVHGHPDGIAVDAEGGTWYADTFGGFVARLSSEGEETDRLEVPAAHTTACALVGEQGDLLAITATDGLYPPEAIARRSGRIYLHEVSVPATRDPGSVGSEVTL